MGTDDGLLLRLLKELGTNYDLDDAAEKLNISSEEAGRLLLTLHKKISKASPIRTGNKTKPMAGSLVAYVDGGSRGNPGVAGAGAYITDTEGVVVGEFKRHIGNATNNVAEYEALLLALNEARDMGCKELEVFADSELVVRQIRGEYKVKNEGLKPLYLKAVSLIKFFKTFSITHVVREKNKEADRLANEAMDEL